MEKLFLLYTYNNLTKPLTKYNTMTLFMQYTPLGIYVLPKDLKSKLQDFNLR